MSDRVDAQMLADWRINYNLVGRTPAEAMRWWHDHMDGKAPAGAVAALGLCINEIERLTAALRAQPGPVSMDDVEWAGKVHLADCEARNQKLHAARTALVAAMEVVKAERERITQYDFVEPKRAEELDAIIAQADAALGREG